MGHALCTFLGYNIILLATVQYAFLAVFMGVASLSFTRIKSGWWFNPPPQKKVISDHHPKYGVEHRKRVKPQNHRSDWLIIIYRYPPFFTQNPMANHQFHQHG